MRGEATRIQQRRQIHAKLKGDDISKNHRLPSLEESKVSLEKHNSLLQSHPDDRQSEPNRETP